MARLLTGYSRYCGQHAPIELRDPAHRADFVPDDLDVPRVRKDLPWNYGSMAV